jgi:acetylornithine deacetylase
VTATALSAPEQRALAEVDPVALLSDLDTLVSIRSLDGEESAAQKVAAGLMRKHGLRTHEWQIDLAELHRHRSFGSEVERSEALGLVGEIGGGSGRSLMLNAHIDVVPAGDESLWAYDPWRVTVAGGNAYGRGALDDKGGVVCAMHAGHHPGGPCGRCRRGRRAHIPCHCAGSGGRAQLPRHRGWRRRPRLRAQ